MPEGTPETPVLARTLIPQDLHDRGYVKPWLDKPWTPELAGEVFKKLDGAESLIGKKTLIPGADAKPEDWDQFLSKLRPEKPEDYEVKVGEGADQEFLKTFREASHHAGVSKVQLSRQLEKLVPVLQAKAKEQADANAAKEAEFDTLVKAAVGPDHEKKVARVGEAIKEFAPEGVRKFIDKLDNTAMALVVGLVHGVLEKYGAEDKINNEGGSGNASNDKETLLNEAKAIYANPAWKNFQHPDHEKLVKREAEIFAHPAFKA